MSRFSIKPQTRKSHPRGESNSSKMTSTKALRYLRSPHCLFRSFSRSVISFLHSLYVLILYVLAVCHPQFAFVRFVRVFIYMFMHFHTFTHFGTNSHMCNYSLILFTLFTLFRLFQIFFTCLLRSTPFSQSS